MIGQVKFEQAVDLSKIQGRFKTKLSLQRRCAGGDPAAAAGENPEDEQLIEIYERAGELKTLFRFSDDSRQLKGWSDCQSFCGLYPFHLPTGSLQEAIQSLASHSIFEGPAARG